MFKICLNVVKALLNENALLARRGGAGPRNKTVQLVEVSLGKIACPYRIAILHLDCYDSALFVIGNLCHVRKMFGGVDVVATVVHVP